MSKVFATLAVVGLLGLLCSFHPRLVQELTNIYVDGLRGQSRDAPGFIAAVRWSYVVLVAALSVLSLHFSIGG